MPRAARSRDRGVAGQLRLFDDDAFRSSPSPEKRLLRLARRPPRPPTPREAREDEAREAMARLSGWGAELAGHFGLRRFVLEPERDGVNEHYGVCYADGLIRIRLRHATTGRLLKESSLVDTLCHELAHLVHLDHSPRFWRTYRTILREARRRGFYRPGPGASRPRQGSLFELVDGPCGTRPGARPERR